MTKEPEREEESAPEQAEDAGPTEEASDDGDAREAEANAKPRRTPEGEPEASGEASAADERPVFAQAYPVHSALDELVAAFERGDYARVRAEAPRLAEGDADPAVKRAARDLVRRTQPDAVSTSLLAIAALLLAFLTYWFFTHKHGPGT